MNWFRLSRRKKSSPRFNILARLNNPPKATLSADGCLVCPHCGAETVATVAQAVRDMQRLELDMVGCSRCGGMFLP